MCLHGALRRCQPVPGDAYLVEQVADLNGWGPEWNDDESTTWSMVRERLAHVEVSDDDLAGTFGPQWEQIVALVRRAAALTSEEAQRLVAAAALDAAGYTTFPAAWNAAKYAWAAACNAAGYAREVSDFKVAAWTAAGYAAKALAVRHMIGQHGFTQARYDKLTGLRTVIGKLHPDDADIAA